MIRLLTFTKLLVVLCMLSACTSQSPQVTSSQTSETTPTEIKDEIANNKQQTGALEPGMIEEVAAPSPEPDPINIENEAAVIQLCDAIGNKLGSVSVSECQQQHLKHSAFTPMGNSLAIKEYLPLEQREPLGKVLLIGGIHGDEYSSVSIVFKWMEILNQHHSGLFHWLVVPTVNPDGLLREKSQRQNSRGVDLNRNFPTDDWQRLAIKYWEEKAHRNPRRNPGEGPASEVETKWLLGQIESFAPDVIITIHAPYHLVDYDGPPDAPDNLGSLHLRKLGVYPGSMGNYIGIDKNLPIVTVELKSAGIMPTTREINLMWNDLVHWLRLQLDDDMKSP